MKKIVILLLAALTVVCQAKLVDDFESYDTGITRLVASPPWTAGTNTGTTRIVDDGTGNQALIFGWAEGLRGVFNNNIDPVLDNTTGTVLSFGFYMVNGNVNNSFGLTDNNGDSSTVYGFNDFEVQFGFGDSTGSEDNQANIYVRNGSESYNTVIDLQSWYYVWAIIDQVNDTYDVYLAKDEPVFKNASLIAFGSSFRNAGSGPVGDLVALLGLGYKTPPENLYIDNIHMGDLLHIPYDESVSQVSNGNVVDVTLNWKPAIDSEVIYDINPDIVEEFVFVGTDADNQYFFGQLGDPGTDLVESEFAVSLDYDTIYYWTVVDALDGHSHNFSMANTLDDVDPNYCLVGETWSFETLPSIAVITEEPVDARAFETDAVAEFSFAFNTTKNSVVAADWYKDDVKLEDGDGVVVTFTDTVGDGTATLSIANPTLDDEGKYYCILSTVVGSAVTSDDVQTATRLLRIKKLLAEYTFDNAEDPLEDTGEFASEIGSIRDAAEVMTVPVEDPNSYVATAVVPTIVAGIKGNALYLDGDEYVDLDSEGYPKAGPLDTLGDIRGDANFDRVGLGRGLDEGTILCWAKLDFGSVMIANGNNSGGNHFAMDLSGDDTARIIVRDDSWEELGEARGSYSYMDGYSFYDGYWHMIAATWSGNTVKVYINGEQVAQNSQSYPNNFVPWESGNLIGAYRNGQPNRHMLGGFMVGAIDEVRIYNYEISGDDIADEYGMLNELGVTPCQNHNFVGKEFNYDNTAASYCVVDLVDFAAMASNWLASGF